MNKAKRLISILLTAAMLVTSVPAFAFAGDMRQYGADVFRRISNPENTEREVDGINSRNNSYIFSIEERGGKLYIATTRNMCGAVLKSLSLSLGANGIVFDTNTVQAAADLVTDYDAPNVTGNDYTGTVFVYDKTKKTFTELAGASEAIGEDCNVRNSIRRGDDIYYMTYNSSSRFRYAAGEAEGIEPCRIIKLDKNDNFTTIYSTYTGSSLRPACIYDYAVYFAGGADAAGGASQSQITVFTIDENNGNKVNPVADYRDFGDYVNDPYLNSTLTPPCWEMAAYDGDIYLSIPGTHGFVIFKGHPSKPGEAGANTFGWVWTEVVGKNNGVNNTGLCTYDSRGYTKDGSYGPGDEPNLSVVSILCVYNDELYIADYDNTLGAALSTVSGLFRLLGGASPDVLVDDMYRTLTHSQQMWKLDKQSGKFLPVEEFNAFTKDSAVEYIWRAYVHNGDMYVGAEDSFVFYEYMLDILEMNALGLSKENWPKRREAMENLSDALMTEYETEGHFMNAMLSNEKAAALFLPLKIILENDDFFLGIGDAIYGADSPAGIAADTLNYLLKPGNELRFISVSAAVLSALAENTDGEGIIGSILESLGIDIGEGKTVKEYLMDILAGFSGTAEMIAPLIDDSAIMLIRTLIDQAKADESMKGYIVSMLESLISDDESGLPAGLIQSMLTFLGGMKEGEEGPEIDIDTLIVSLDCVISLYEITFLTDKKYPEREAAIKEFLQAEENRTILCGIIARAVSSLAKEAAGAVSGSLKTEPRLLQSSESEDESETRLKAVMDPGIFAKYLTIKKILKRSNPGFDIYRGHISGGKLSWELVVDDGFGDKYNYGAARFCSSEDGLYIGTQNPFYGCQLWLLEDGSAEQISENIEMTAGEVIKGFVPAGTVCRSSDPTIAWIDEDGSLNAMKKGEAVIRIPSGNGGYSSCKVKVEEYTDGSEVIGNLKILARFNDSMQFYDGHSYLLFTSYQDGVELTVDDLYGGYEINDQYYIDIAKDISNGSNHTGVDSEKYFEFIPGMTSMTLNRGDIVTIGMYRGFDLTVPQAALGSFINSSGFTKLSNDAKSVLTKALFRFFDEGSMSADELRRQLMAVAANSNLTPERLLDGSVSGGVCFNRELYNQKLEWDQFENVTYELDITRNQLDSLMGTLGGNLNKFSILNNSCATVVLKAWNAAVGTRNGVDTAYKLSAKGEGIFSIMDAPKTVKASIMDRLPGYHLNNSEGGSGKDADAGYTDDTGWVYVSAPKKIDPINFAYEDGPVTVDADRTRLHSLFIAAKSGFEIKYDLGGAPNVSMTVNHSRNGNTVTVNDIGFGFKDEIVALSKYSDYDDGIWFRLSDVASGAYITGADGKAVPTEYGDGYVSVFADKLPFTFTVTEPAGEKSYLHTTVVNESGYVIEYDSGLGTWVDVLKQFATATVYTKNGGVNTELASTASVDAGKTVYIKSQYFEGSDALLYSITLNGKSVMDSEHYDADEKAYFFEMPSSYSELTVKYEFGDLEMELNEPLQIAVGESKDLSLDTWIEIYSEEYNYLGDSEDLGWELVSTNGAVSLSGAGVITGVSPGKAEVRVYSAENPYNSGTLAVEVYDDLSALCAITKGDWDYEYSLMILDESVDELDLSDDTIWEKITILPYSGYRVEKGTRVALYILTDDEGIPCVDVTCNGTAVSSGAIVTANADLSFREVEYETAIRGIPETVHLASKGDTYQFEPKMPAYYSGFSYKSSDSLVSVDENGLVTIKGDIPENGKAAIVTISSKDEYYQETTECKVIVGDYDGDEIVGKITVYARTINNGELIAHGSLAFTTYNDLDLDISYYEYYRPNDKYNALMKGYMDDPSKYVAHPALYNQNVPAIENRESFFDKITYGQDSPAHTLSLKKGETISISNYGFDSSNMESIMRAFEGSSLYYMSSACQELVAQMHKYIDHDESFDGAATFDSMLSTLITMYMMSSAMGENPVNGHSAGGQMVNRELYNQFRRNDLQTPNNWYSIEITADELTDMEKYLSDPANNYYSIFTKNCGGGAADIWNAAMSDRPEMQIKANYTGLSTDPQSLYFEIGRMRQKDLPGEGGTDYFPTTYRELGTTPAPVTPDDPSGGGSSGGGTSGGGTSGGGSSGGGSSSGGGASGGAAQGGTSGASSQTGKPAGVTGDVTVSSKTDAGGNVITTASVKDGTNVTTTTDTSGKVVSVAAEVSAEAAKEGGIVTLPASVPKNTELSIAVPSDSEVDVAIPVENAKASTVVYKVNEDGSRELIKDAIVENGTVVASVDESCKLVVADNQKSFRDTGYGRWSDQYIDFVASHEILNGNGDGTFGPLQTVLKGMVIQALYNIDKDSAPGNYSKFTDSSKLLWFGDSVGWASDEELLTGNPDGSSGGMDDADREVTVTLMYRYAKRRGLDSGKRESLDKFRDAGTVRSYSKEAFEWATAEGIITGDDRGRLNPDDGANREQLSAIVTRFVQYMNRVKAEAANKQQ